MKRARSSRLVIGQGAQGNQGFQGPIGIGQQGFQGLTGDTGAQGSTGSQGDQGFQGDTGAKGDQGFQGDTGAQGSTGSQGDQGFQGDTGAQGDQGFQGDTGARGDQGFQGLKGDTGSQGDQGFQGSPSIVQGPQGFQGLTGNTGAQGSTGSQGDQGFQGDTGAKGDQGFQGDTGAKGDQGFQGVSGANGISEAPTDSKQYARFNSTWQEVVASGGASVAIDDAVPTGDDTLWYQPSMGRMLIKVDGQWVSVSKDGKDGVDGYTPVKNVDYFDGADAVLTDNSVTTAKLHGQYKSRTTMAALNVDFSAAQVFTKTITGNSTLTFSNLHIGVKDLEITGDFTLALPAWVKVISGEYNGSVANLIQVGVTNDTASSESGWCTISQEAS